MKLIIIPVEKSEMKSFSKIYDAMDGLKWLGYLINYEEVNHEAEIRFHSEENHPSWKPSMDGNGFDGTA